jgi:hypothetical protein
VNGCGVLALVCCSALLGCSACDEGSPNPGATSSPEAVARYGEAPARNPAGFTYQPDVVVVGGGAAAVRSVSDDGLIWTVDAGAAGIGDLDVGKVMFLTSRAAGRVADIDKAGADVRVTLAPVQLTEVIRDGHIKLDTPIQLDDALVQEIPDMPGKLSEPDPADVAGPNGFARTPMRPMAGRAETLPPPKAPPPKTEAEISVGDWETNISVEPSGLGLQLSYKPSEQIKAGLEATLGGKSFRLLIDVLVAGGKVSNPTAVIHGIEYLDLKAYAGVAGGADDNRKVKIEVPAEIVNKGFPAFGIPMVFNFKVKAFIIMAMSGKNSTLTASGRWGLAGPLGVSAGAPSLPGFSVISSIMDSIGGIAIGPSGVVFGAEFKFMLGIGVPGIATGPYAKFKFSAGVTNGSALGAPLARCHRADLSIEGGGGVGLSVGSAGVNALLKRVPKWPIKLELESEFMGQIAKASQTRPNVPLCAGK